MTCTSCVAREERALKAVPRVTDASVTLATESARIAGVAEAGALLAAVPALGYGAQIAGATTAETAGQRREREVTDLTRDLILAAVLTLPVLMLEMGEYPVPAFHPWLLEPSGKAPVG